MALFYKQNLLIFALIWKKSSPEKLLFFFFKLLISKISIWQHWSNHQLCFLGRTERFSSSKINITHLCKFYAIAFLVTQVNKVSSYYFYFYSNNKNKTTDWSYFCRYLMIVGRKLSLWGLFERNTIDRCRQR